MARDPKKTKETKKLPWTVDDWALLFLCLASGFGVGAIPRTPLPWWISLPLWAAALSVLVMSILHIGRRLRVAREAEAGGGAVGSTDLAVLGRLVRGEAGYQKGPDGVLRASTWNH